MPGGVFERILAWADGEPAAAEAARLDAFRRFVLLYGAVRSWLWLPFLGTHGATAQPLGIAASAVALTACAAGAWLPGRAAWAARLALPVLLFQLAATFPLSDNHFFLELACLGLVALAGPDGEGDAVEVVRSLRWLCALVLFQAGLQKVLYGHYWHGDFLAFMAASDARFAALWSPLLDPAQLEALRGQDVLRTGAGPFRLASWPLRIASNAVVAGELLLPAALLWRRTRAAATAAAVALVVAIQSGAREFGFAILFGNLALLFAPPVWSRRAVPVFAVVFALALAAAVGLLPRAWLDPGFL